MSFPSNEIDFNYANLYNKLTNLQSVRNLDSFSFETANGAPTNGGMPAPPQQMGTNGHGGLAPTHNNNGQYNMQPIPGSNSNPFGLPVELQGGISNISSRRPSYAAESLIRSNFMSGTPYVANKFNLDDFNESFSRVNINSNLSDFHSRRPSQFEFYGPVAPQANNMNLSGNGNNEIHLENGLILKNQYIIASQDLKQLFSKATNYFTDVSESGDIINEMKTLLNNPLIIKLINFIKNLNNLNFNHKSLCLVINKNGKFDLLSLPNSSNIYLQKNDLCIVDGDRGKDIVMILEPIVELNFAILFNFLKKREHLKSLRIVDSGNNPTNNGAAEDNEFIINLPTKQVLRFATPQEVMKIIDKYLEERKAYQTCLMKIKELKLTNDLKLINVEYQFDFKKLIFYYFADFKRIDFRNLIKELFKIYKTRIWLCAVLPYNGGGISAMNAANDDNEYNLTQDQLVNFKIEDFANIKSSYFHSKNLKNLIEELKFELHGEFYGFNKFNNNNNNNTGGAYTYKFDPFRS